MHGRLSGIRLPPEAKFLYTRRYHNERVILKRRVLCLTDLNEVGKGQHRKAVGDEESINRREVNQSSLVSKKLKVTLATIQIGFQHRPIIQSIPQEDEPEEWSR